MSTIETRVQGSVGLRSAGELGLAGTLSGPVAAGDMPFVAGRFSVFDQWTEISSVREGRFLERIAPGAFTRSLREDRAHMRILYDHGADPFIGSRPIAPIDVLGEDGIGAYYAGKMFPTMAARELLPLLEARVLGSSFRFSVHRERTDDRPTRSDHNPERLPERTILEATVFEFGPVVFPAYRGATAGTSTGGHPPRSAVSSGEFLRRITTPHRDTPAERQARERWLDEVAPLVAGR